MIMVKRVLLAAVAIAFITVLAVPSDAKQIRLSDGRFLQGEVVEKNQDGFKFKLTESGGKIFLRWNQVDGALRKELLEEKEPDEGLNLKVEVKGARLELITGEIFEGYITPTSGGYTLINRNTAKTGKFIAVEDGELKEFQKDIDINASNVMNEEDVLKLAETQRAPLERAQQHYEMARIAERLGLYEQAKEFVTSGLGAAPDKKLQAVLEAYGTRLDELIKQRELLNALAKARKDATENKFKQALELLAVAKKEFKPEGEVLATFEATEKDVDNLYTLYVVEHWYKAMKAVTYTKSKDKNLTVQTAMNWARSQMDSDIVQYIATKTGGDVNDIKRRFLARNREKLPLKKCTFGEDGYYDVIGGHLPSVGRRPLGADNTPIAPEGDTRSRAERERDAERGRDRYVAPLSGDELAEFLAMLEAMVEADEKIQSTPKTPSPQPQPGPQPAPGERTSGNPAPSPEISKQMEELLKKYREGNPGGGVPSSNPSVRPDNTGLEVPATVPSIEDWWKMIGRQRKAEWMLAVYCTMNPSITVFERKYWNVWYK